MNGAVAVESLLGGALTLERLPEGGRPGGRFRAADARGAVAFPFWGERTEYLHVVEFAEAGVRRGFHLHRGHRERLYLFSGRLRLVARAPGSGEVVERTLEPGDLATLAPGVAHGFVSLSPAVAVAAGTGSDPLDDTVPAPDLPLPRLDG